MSIPPFFSDLFSEEPSKTSHSSFANGLVHSFTTFLGRLFHRNVTQNKEEFIIGYRSFPKIVTHYILISICWSAKFECFCNTHSTSLVIHSGMKHCKKILFYVPLKSFQTVVFLKATILNMRQINTALEKLHHTDKEVCNMPLDPIVSV